MNVAGHFSSLRAAVLPPPADSGRQPHVVSLFTEYEQAVFARTNQFFTWLFLVQWSFCMVFAAVWSPLTWAGRESSVHPHLIAAIFLGGLLCLPPIWLMRLRPNELITRQVVAVAQVGFSALLIDLTGGRIETHFHVFVSLAFLALYRDWRVLPTATLVVAVDHLARGIWFPESVYGVPYATVWRTGEHAVWVVFEDVVLAWACLVSRREMWEICLRHDQNECLLGDLEQRVRDRTSALEAEVRERERTAEKMQAMHLQLVEASRQAGRADVATGVLHNVGNVLTSVNLIVHDIQDRLRATRLNYLHRLVEVVQTERHHLPEFLASDPRGQALPDFLVKLDGQLATENESLSRDVRTLVGHFEHIRQIIVVQQSSAKLMGVVETVAPEKLVEEALQINWDSFSRHGISLTRKFDAAPSVRVDRHKVMQILVNLLKNAKDSVLSRQESARRITVRIGGAAGGKAEIAVEDDGGGIAPENMLRIFQHGFTTKKDGHGFGLHSCVLAAREMSGDLAAASAGPGQGATFTLTLPVAT